MNVCTFCFTATLISLQQRVQGTSSLYEGPRQLPTDVSTTWNKLISFCHHRRVCVAVILLLLLMMVILVTLIVYFTYGSVTGDPKPPFLPPPEGKSVSVPSSRVLFINLKVLRFLVTHMSCAPFELIFQKG
jgi:hypothetical protein